MIEVSNPQARAVKGRRANLKKIWSSKEWKEKREAFLKEHPYCEMHLSVGVKVPATVPHHPYRNSYKGHYDDLSLSQCVAYCTKCHFCIHKGRKLCPICKSHYCGWDQEMCWPCYCEQHPEIMEGIERAKAEKKERAKQARRKAYQKAKELKKAKDRAKKNGGAK